MNIGLEQHKWQAQYATVDQQEWDTLQIDDGVVT
jgi:hypothetical protein